MSVFGEQFRNSNLKNPVPVVFDSDARVNGGTNSFEIQLNQKIDRVRKFTINDIVIPRTYNALNEGNTILSLRAETFPAVIYNGNLYITPGTYTITEMTDIIKSSLSRQKVKAIFGYDEDNSKFYFETNLNGPLFILYDRGVNPSISSTLDYDFISTVLPTLGFFSDQAFTDITTGRLYGSIPIKWDVLTIEDRNNRIPVSDSITGISFVIPDGTYDVHTLAALIQTNLNASLIGTWICGFSLINNNFFIKSDRLFVPIGVNSDNSIFGLSGDAAHSITGSSVIVNEPLLTANLLSLIIKDTTIRSVTLPDLNNATLIEAASNLETALGSPYSVSVDKQNNVFVLRSSEEFTLLNVSASFAATYGLTILSVPGFYQHGNVSHYPTFSYTRVAVSSLRFSAQLETGLIPSGTYEFGSFSTALQLALNVDFAAGAPWVVSYNTDINKYTITGGTPNDIIIYSTESIYKQLGILLESTLISSFPYTSQIAPVMDPNNYIYIKSYALNQNKELNIFASDRYSNVIGRVIVNSQFRGVVSAYFSGIVQIIYPLNVGYTTLDFRLEFENNRLVELDNSWSIGIVFAQF